LTDKERADAAEALRSLIDDRTVFIASSDLTHYGADFGYLPFRADGSTAERLRELDGAVMNAAGSLEAEVFRGELERTGSTVCGRDPVSLLLETIEGANGEEVFQETLDYETSGDITGDYRHSVSYGALGYFPASRFAVGPEAAETLRKAARQAVKSFEGTVADHPELWQDGRAFVTLYSAAGALRGCVGVFEKTAPLAEMVPRLTSEAGHADRRFAPVRPDEAIDIEIHLLTPGKRIRDRERIRLGEHGVYLEARGRRGLLLAGVATAHGLDRNALLTALADKAGVRRDVYEDEQTRLSIFREQVIWDRHG
jgi:AmmeMemoRadiSam system protein A